MTQDWEPCGCAEGCDDCGGHDRGRTYTIETSPENTIDWRTGFYHGALGRRLLAGQSDNYCAGFAVGYFARRESL